MIVKKYILIIKSIYFFLLSLPRTPETVWLDDCLKISRLRGREEEEEEDPLTLIHFRWAVTPPQDGVGIDVYVLLNSAAQAISSQ